jgi:hypothetical protein
MAPMKRPQTPKPRMWRASLLRAKAECLGVVYASDRGAAERIAAEQFALSTEQRKRLMVEEQP